MNKEIIDKIINEVCKYYSFTPIEVFNETRKKEIVQVRQLCQYLILKYTKLSLHKVGEVSSYYGRKRKHNHATIIHSVKEVEYRVETDLDFYVEFNFLVSTLNKSIVLDVYPVFRIKNKHAKFEINDNVNVDLMNENKKLKAQINNVSKYEAINELLSLEHSEILECIKYKIEPHLKMLKSKVTNKDLVDFQKQTRKM